MAERRKYFKKATEFVVAVQIDLDTQGFLYKKWGDTQTCEAGDWILNNDGETYTVDRDTFERTYRRMSPGTYVKAAPVWAQKAHQSGRTPPEKASLTTNRVTISFTTILMNETA